MRHICVLLSRIAVLFSLPLTALADTVYLQDGTLLKGEIVGLKEGKLSIKTDYAENLSIPLSSVSGMTSLDNLELETTDAELFQGKLIYSEDQGQRFISHRAGKISLSPGDIARVWGSNFSRESAREKALENVWSGHLKLGFSASEGNTEQTDFYGKVAALRESDFDRLSMSLESSYETDAGQEIKNEFIAKGKLERDINERLFGFTALSMERDKFEELDLRTYLSAGLGYFVIKEPAHEFKPRLGLGYEVSSLEKSKTESEVVLTLGYDYRVDLWEKLRFEHSVTYSPALDHFTDNYRIDSEAGLAYPLNQEQTWNASLTLKHQFDAEPAPGVEKLDSFYAIGLERRFQ